MNIPLSIHATWQQPLLPLFDLPSMVELNMEILPKCQFYPEPKNIFNVFKMPLNEVKVVILGQDPYPQPGQAIGYSFAVAANRPAPKSLQIIHKEVMQEMYPSQALPLDYPDTTSWKTLAHWRQQGVFLLNTALTVERARAGSHVRLWRPFMNGVIEILAKQNPIWLLWGEKAQVFTPTIVTGGTRALRVLTAAHPASEAYPGNKGGFTGCGHFKEVNQILSEEGKNPIIW